MDCTELFNRAQSVAKLQKLSGGAVAGEVGCALLTAAGNVYVGVSVDCASGIGFCAEHSAIARMLTSGESAISAIVAVSSDGKILPPCGRCRELMYQVNRDNLRTDVIIGVGKTVKLEELLPFRWQEAWD